MMTSSDYEYTYKYLSNSIPQVKFLRSTSYINKCFSCLDQSFGYLDQNQSNGNHFPRQYLSRYCPVHKAIIIRYSYIALQFPLILPQKVVYIIM